MPKLTAKQLTICIVLIAVLLRLPEFMITLAYDEAWTLINFAPLPVKQLFFDLALPNNHPLNSVLIKLIAEFTLPVDFIRLPSMLAGIGAILLAGAIVKKLWSDTAAYWCMFFMAVNAPLAVYSAQARGYMLQIFFLLLYTYCVINSYYRQKNSRNPLPADCGVILCALASVTVLPTSSLYLAGITVILWNGINFKKIPRRLLITLTVAALLSATYLLINFNDLQTARHWGTSISSSTGFLSWMWENTVMLVPLFLLPLMIVSLYRERQYLIGIAAYFLIIFGSGILTNGGSARVYLPC